MLKLLALTVQREVLLPEVLTQTRSGQKLIQRFLPRERHSRIETRAGIIRARWWWLEFLADPMVNAREHGCQSQIRIGISTRHTMFYTPRCVWAGGNPNGYRSVVITPGRPGRHIKIGGKPPERIDVGSKNRHRLTQ